MSDESVRGVVHTSTVVCEVCGKEYNSEREFVQDHVPEDHPSKRR